MFRNEVILNLMNDRDETTKHYAACDVSNVMPKNLLKLLVNFFLKDHVSFNRTSVESCLTAC